MADRGFEIKEDLGQAKYTQKGKDETELVEIRRIATLRIHVE